MNCIEISRNQYHGKEAEELVRERGPVGVDTWKEWMEKDSPKEYIGRK